MPLTDAELMERLNRQTSPTGALLGCRVVEVDSAAGRVRMRYEAKPAFCNPMGNVQGGFVAAMLDDAAAVAALVKSGRRIIVPTLEFKVSFLAAARVGPLIAEGRCLRLGKRIAFLEAELLDLDGRSLARMSATAMPVPMPDNPRMVDRA